MRYLSPADIQYFTGRLISRRDALRTILRATVITSLRAERPPLGDGVHDTGEESFAEMTLGVDIAAHMREIQELQDIDVALKRIPVRPDRFLNQMREESAESIL